MTPTMLAPENWLQAMLTSIEELVQVTLASSPFECLSNADDGIIPWHHTIGAYVPIVADEFSMHLGLLSSPDGCRQLARGLLSKSLDDELSDEDMADALREIVNILGGMTKIRMEGDISQSTLGLPIFINGHIQLTKEQEASLQMIKIGSVDCYLIVLKQR